jgi:hypothetical protein
MPGLVASRTPGSSIRLGPDLSPAEWEKALDELVERAVDGDAKAARMLEDALERLAWRSATGGFPSKPASSNDFALIDTCLSLQRDRRFSARADAVLSTLPPGEIDAARRRAATAPPPRRARALVPGQLLERYRAGEHEAVWSELVKLGALQSNEERQEAAAVAGETMALAATAIDELVRRLAARGYPFRVEARQRPVGAKSVERLVKTSGGPVPASLVAFWQIVGGVDLAPDYDRPVPDWWPGEVPVEMIDPLVVNQLDHLWGDVEEWGERDKERDDADASGKHLLSIAPDRYHKMNISGGPAYSIELPDASADTPVLYLDYVEGDPLFVTYLREAVRAGGFPGVVASGRAGPEWTRIIQDLTEGIGHF